MAQNQFDHPAHYNQNGIECFDVIKAAIGVDGFKNFCEGNLIKYAYRMRIKGQYLDDLVKIRNYANELIKLQEVVNRACCDNDNNTIMHLPPMDKYIFDSINDAQKKAIEDYEKEVNGKSKSGKTTALTHEDVAKENI